MITQIRSRTFLNIFMVFGLSIGFIHARLAIAGDSSPYLIGHWKLADTFSEQDTTGKNVSTVVTDNTEFVFLNPTPLTLTLEYAFFANDGTFCGCDRDTLGPNGRTRYTMAGEKAGGQFLAANCPSTDGAMKTIVFIREKKGKPFIGDGLQAGYQIDFFGGVNGGRTESSLQAVPLNSSVVSEINYIHNKCKQFIH